MPRPEEVRSSAPGVVSNFVPDGTLDDELEKKSSRSGWSR